MGSEVIKAVCVLVGGAMSLTSELSGLRHASIVA